MIGLANFQRQWECSAPEYLAAVDRVGKSGWLILGREVSSFEADLARYWGLRYAVGCASGLDALEIAFRCLGMKAGDRVLTTPLSAFATTLAILRVGAVPVFADVDVSGQLDLKAAANTIENTSVRPLFMVPVHLYGHAMNLSELESFAREHKLTVIEDCAQAIGARSQGRAVGTVGRMCATSFYPTKNLGAFGDGGALLTDDESLRDRARILRDYGQSEKYIHQEVGLNSRLDEMHAALLRSVQLPKLAEQTRRRQEIAQRYIEGIRNVRVEILPAPTGSESVWHLFPLRVKHDRAAFQRHLDSRGVGSAVHYPRLIPHQPALQQLQAEMTTAALPCAEELAHQEVSLPIHPFLTDDEIRTVIDAANTWEGQ